jgi:SOS-response transcriptional repressor LexA
MPTKKPRVTLAVPDDVYDLLKEYEKKHGCKNQSQAILSLIETGYEKIANQSVQMATEQAAKRDFFKKFDALDSHGKDMVKTVLSKEYKRCMEKPDDSKQIIEIPYSLYKVSAGGGYMLSDDWNRETMFVEYTALTRKADFCINVSGDSMQPKFYDGDILLIRKQPAVDIGEIGIFTMDGCGYVKENGKKELVSLNPDYPNIPKKNDIKCWGKVLGIVEKEWIK